MKNIISERKVEIDLILKIKSIIIVINFGQASLSRPKNLELEIGASSKLLGCGRKVDPNHLGHAALSDPRLWGPCLNPRLLCPASGPIGNVSASGLKANGSYVITQFF